MQTNSQFLSQLIQLSELRLKRERGYSFPNHEGRLGLVGGSLPRDAGGGFKIPDDVYFPGEKVDMHKMEGGMLRRLNENVAFGGRPAEEAAITDSDGILLHGLTGTVGHVEIPQAIVDQAKKAGNWRVTHTHPNGPMHNNGASFSDGDVMMAITMNLSEIRTVSQGPLGRFEFSLKRPEKGWPLSSVFWKEEENNRLELDHYLSKRILEGKISRATMNLAFSHAVMTMTARKLGLNYSMKRYVGETPRW